MDLITENFRNRKFGAIEQMIREGKRDEVVKAIDSFDQCLFLEREARSYKGIMACVAEVAARDANNIEMYLFAWRHSTSPQVRKSIVAAISNMKLDVDGLIILLTDYSKVFNDLGIVKLEEMEITFEDCMTIYPRIPLSVNTSRTKSLKIISSALFKKMLKVSGSLKEKLWLLNRATGEDSAVVKENIAKYLW